MAVGARAAWWLDRLGLRRFFGGPPRIHGYVDGVWVTPAPFREGSVLRLRGWCFAEDSAEGVELVLLADGTEVLRLACEGHRGDVHEGFREQFPISSLPWCGFDVALHVPGTALPRMQLVEARGGELFHERAAGPAFVRESAYDPCVTVMDEGQADPGFAYHVDLAELWSGNGEGAPSQQLALRGWCVSDGDGADASRGPMHIQVRADGEVVGELPLSGVRPDVLDSLGIEVETDRPCAFQGEVTVPVGATRLEVVSREHGVVLGRVDAERIRVRTDAIPAAVPAGLRHHIEHVGLLTDALGTGDVLDLRGWCFDVAAAGPAELELRVDGRSMQRAVARDVRSAVASWFPGVQGGSLPRCGFGMQLYVSTEMQRAELRHGSGAVLGSWALADLREVARAHAESVVETNGAEPPRGPPPYVLHQEANRIRPHVRAVLAAAAAEMQELPRFTVVMPVCDPEPDWLASAVASVHEQIYPEVELVLADDASTRSDVHALLDRLEQHAHTVVVRCSERGNISAATNAAAARATGDYLVFMDHDDLLAPHALFEMAMAVRDDPAIDVLYSDEDKIDLEGRRYDPMFKPGPSPVLLLGYNYFNHLTCVRRTLFHEVGGLRSAFDGAQDYDLLLRLTERTRHVHHVPGVLYHWRAVPGSIAAAPEEKPAVLRSVEAGLREALERRGQATGGLYRPDFARQRGLPIFQLEGEDTGPMVTIVIPSRNQVDALGACVSSLLERTRYRNFELLIVDNESDCPRTLAYLAGLDDARVRVVRIGNGPEGFSFSRINNRAVESLESEYVLFLNDDTEVLEERWLSRMMRYMRLDGVGAVGARLLYPDDTIQHAGVLLHAKGRVAPDHAFLRHPADHLSRGFLAETAREVAAVTGACLLTRRDRFLSMGGFEAPPFHVSLSDVDYCLRLVEHDLRTVYVPGAELRHHESLSREREDDPSELAAFKQRHRFDRDPYDNPNVVDSRHFEPGTRCTLDHGRHLGRKLRVSCYVHNLELEGTPKLLVDLARGLAPQGDVELEVVAFRGGALSADLEQMGVTSRVIELPGSDNVLAGFDGAEGYAKACTRIREDLEEHRPDVVAVVVVHNFFIVDAARAAGIPSLWFIQESYDRETLLRSVPDYGHEDLERAFASVHRVVFAAEVTRRCYDWLGVRHRSVVVPNAIAVEPVDQLMADLDVAAARRAIGIDEDRTLILSVGTLCARKHQETIVRAFAEVAKRHDRAHLALVGARAELSYTQLLEGLVQHYGLAGRVELVAETRDVYRYFRAADIFAFSSLLESHPWVVLEAMAFGLPLVVTPPAGSPDQIRPVNSRCVAVRDPHAMAQALSELIEHDELRATLGRNARKTFEYLPGYGEMIERYRSLLWSAWLAGPTTARR